MIHHFFINHHKTIYLNVDSQKEKSILVAGGKLTQKMMEHYARYPNDIKTMNRRLFEELVAELFSDFGYDVELTQKTRDGGKDIIAISNFNDIRSKFLIECKRPEPNNAVGIGVVRELMGVKTDERATKAIAVTSTYFSKDAHLFQQRNQWELDLKEYQDLENWLNNYQS